MKRYLLSLVAVMGVILIAVLIVRNSNTLDSDSTEVGAILALTGANGELGEKIRLGMELACERHNSSFPDSKIRLLFEDSKSNAKDGVTAFNKLTDTNGCKIVLGNASFLAAALSPMADERGTLFVAVASAKPNITKDRELVVRYFPTSETIAKTVVKYTSERFKRVAVLHLEDEYANDAMVTFRRETESSGGECVFIDSYRTGDTEFRTLVEKMLSKSPEAVFVPGFGPAFIAIIKTIRESSPDLPIIGDIPLAVPANIDALGEAAEGIIVPTSRFDSGIASSDIQKFLLKELNNRGVERPDVFLASGFDSVTIIGDAIAKTDGSPMEVRKYIVSNQHEGVCGNITYLPNGESVVPIELLQIRSNKLRVLK